MKLFAAAVLAASLVFAPVLSAGTFPPPRGEKQAQPGVKNHAGKHQGARKHHKAKRHHKKMMKKHHHQKGGQGQGKGQNKGNKN